APPGPPRKLPSPTGQAGSAPVAVHRPARQAAIQGRSRSDAPVDFSVAMSLPRVVAVAEGSPAARAGLLPGDQFLTVGGRVPRDVIEYRLLTDEPAVELEVARGGLAVSVVVDKAAGEPLGVEVQSALFDRIRTCDNHCEFCFIYQL